MMSLKECSESGATNGWYTSGFVRRSEDPKSIYAPRTPLTLIICGKTFWTLAQQQDRTDTELQGCRRILCSTEGDVTFE